MNTEEFTLLGFSLTELASIFTATCALILTIWQSSIARKHNKLSVKPVICSWYHVDEKSFVFQVINKGLGTAKIDKFTIKVGTEELSRAEFSDLLKERFDEHGDNIFYSSGFSDGSYFEKGEKIDFVRVNFNKDIENLKGFNELLEQCQLIIEYSSLYGIKDTFISDNL